MATNSSSVNPTPANNPKSDNSKQRLIAIAAVIIVALLGINAFLLVSYNKKGKANNRLSTELNESEQLKADLEKQYYEALSELEEMRGSNEELNALIEEQKAEIGEQKDRIAAMLGDSRNYDKARKELKKMKAQVEQYLAEINQLREQNQELMATNEQLNTEKQVLSTDLESQRMANQELTTVQATLVSEKEALETERNMLSKKVDIASVIKVDNLDVSGIKVKSSGKPVKKKFAKNIDQLKVCFTTTANQVADPGTEQFHIRIISPLGETLAIDELGSGSFKNEANGDEIRFTQVKEHEYNQDASNICTTWSPNQPFPKGNYAVEIYNKGYLAGTGSVQLK